MPSVVVVVVVVVVVTWCGRDEWVVQGSGWELVWFVVVVDSNDKYTKRKMSVSRAVHDNSDQYIYSSCGS